MQNALQIWWLSRAAPFQKSCALAPKYFGLEMTHITSVHRPLARTSHLALPTTWGQGNGERTAGNASAIEGERVKYDPIISIYIKFSVSRMHLKKMKIC